VQEGLRARYWGAEVFEDPQTGALDFSNQDREREAALRDARRLGIPESNITERSQMFTDPHTQAVFDLYNEDMDTLRTYWKGTSDLVGEKLDPKKRLIWDEFVKEQGPNEKQQLRNRYPFVKVLEKRRGALREQVRRQAPDIDVALMFWEYSTEAKTSEGREVQRQLRAQ